MEMVVSTTTEEQSHPAVQSNHRLKTDIAWKYVIRTEDGAGKKSLLCLFCQKVFRGGGINRMKQHLAGVKGDVASCVKVTEDVKLLIQGVLEEKAQKAKANSSALHVHNLDGGERAEEQIIPAIEGKRKATSDLQLYSKRVMGNDGDHAEALPPGIKVSKFDYSVENHFNYIDKISMLSEESELEDEQTEIQRLSSSVTFLSFWRDFSYQSLAIRFACEKETSTEQDVTARINLPQFSSAAVPKDISVGNEITSSMSKDFVMYVGGPVWALDWCPRAHQSSTFDTNVEFIAVSAHPPESSYHQIGAPLTGRGLIQIWCILNTGLSQQAEIPFVKVKARKPSKIVDPTKPKKPRGRPRKTPPINQKDDSDQSMEDLNAQPVSKGKDKNVKSIKPKKSRGRPKKQPIEASLNKSDGSNANTQLLTEYTDNSPKTSPEPLAVAFPDNLQLPAPDKIHIVDKKKVTKNDSNVYTRKPTKLIKDTPAKSIRAKSKTKLKKCQIKRKNQVKSADPPILPQICGSPPDQNDVLPRLVMGLAHNGKVARDVKWRPLGSGPISKHVMGSLAVLLGNGALEVWEVPHPRATKAIFSSCKKEGNDPRFLKLKPVFSCSMLKCGDRQSIPLTLEWSAAPPHDLLLAGCHDGVVALWKFSATSESKDTRPLLCFNADTVPIRSLKWAPLASDPESANTIVTAGHKGLKFWDIRDPFHPLWDIPSQKIINSLDWLPDPRCVVISFDDGEIKVISLSKAAPDVLITGMPPDKKQKQGSYTCSYCCSSSSIWSVQVSRSTGMVAYCCSDGKVINFQLTTKTVERDPQRNREPHYLCGSLIEEDASLIVLSPLQNIPIPMKKSPTEWGDTPKSSRGFKSRSNQEKRAKDQLIKSQTLPKQSSVGTLKNNTDTSLETQTQMSQALVCIDNDDKMEQETVKDVGQEGFPPKSVAMHRATWNINKGSERLVCYGGAAGIVRCQLIR